MRDVSVAYIDPRGDESSAPCLQHCCTLPAMSRAVFINGRMYSFSVPGIHLADSAKGDTLIMMISAVLQ